MRSQVYTLVPGVANGDQRQERRNEGLGFLATGLIANNNSPNWWLEPSSNSVIPPGSINQTIVLPGGSTVATLLFQAPPGQVQPAALVPPGALVAQYVDDEALKASYAPSYALLLSITQFTTLQPATVGLGIKQLLRGITAVPAGANIVNVAIPAVNMAKTEVRFHGVRSRNNDPATALPEASYGGTADLVSPIVLRVEVGTPSGSTSLVVSWELTEWL